MNTIVGKLLARLWPATGRHSRRSAAAQEPEGWPWHRDPITFTLPRVEPVGPLEDFSDVRPYLVAWERKCAAERRAA